MSINYFENIFKKRLTKRGGDVIIEGEESGLIQNFADFSILKFSGTILKIKLFFHRKKLIYKWKIRGKTQPIRNLL